MSPPLTAGEATALHEASLLAVCERVERVENLDTKLVVTPDERVADLAKLVAQCRMTGNSGAPPVRHSTIDIRHFHSDCWPQGEGDLGRRLFRGTKRAFDAGTEGVLLLGTDSPTMPADFLTRAVAALSRHDAVLGPCDDGGYYLLGLRRHLPVLFERIDWGGACVADQTRQRATEAGIDLFELPTWYDLDRFSDLKRAAQEELSNGVSSHGNPTFDNRHSGFDIALRRLIDRLVETYTER